MPLPAPPVSKNILDSSEYRRVPGLAEFHADAVGLVRLPVGWMAAMFGAPTIPPSPLANVRETATDLP